MSARSSKGGGTAAQHDDSAGQTGRAGFGQEAERAAPGASHDGAGMLTRSFDEVYADDGLPRPHAAALAAALQELGSDELVSAGRRRDAIFMQQGITFDAGGPDEGDV